MVVLYCHFSLDPYFSEPVGHVLFMAILDLTHYMACIGGTEPPEFLPAPDCNDIAVYKIRLHPTTHCYIKLLATITETFN